MRLLALALAVLAFYFFWFQRETPTERRLAEVASAIAGRDVDVRCPSIWKRLVDVSPFQGTAHTRADGTGGYAMLTHEVCRSFDEILADGFTGSYGCLFGAEGTCAKDVYSAAQAVHVLTHEAWHLSGNRNEAEVECFAYQTDAGVATRLGASAAQGVAIAAFAYRMNGKMPSRYNLTAECRPGGKLDLRPATAAWPSA